MSRDQVDTVKEHKLIIRLRKEDYLNLIQIKSNSYLASSTDKHTAVTMMGASAAPSVQPPQLHVKSSIPHLTDIQKKKLLETSTHGFLLLWGQPGVNMREAWLFKTWSNSQTQQQIEPQGPLILGLWSVTLNRAVCSLWNIDRVSFWLISSMCTCFTQCRYVTWSCGTCWSHHQVRFPCDKTCDLHWGSLLSEGHRFKSYAQHNKIISWPL